MYRSHPLNQDFQLSIILCDYGFFNSVSKGKEIACLKSFLCSYISLENFKSPRNLLVLYFVIPTIQGKKDFSKQVD